ncbi:MAG: hypothetical protein SVJ22_01255 [Halobacteriota archaeon]|nr:hypothetical protein [Halobacteriota archaeon]
MGVWIWKQASQKCWRVETDILKGIIKVTDEDGNIISDHTGLSKEAVELMEKNFFEEVAQEVVIEANDISDDTYNPMYV